MLSFLKKFLLRQTPAYDCALIIAGVGNKGVTYQNTRHNIGFAVADALRQKNTVIHHAKECSSAVDIVKMPGEKTIALAKPETYVNRSGRAVRELLTRYGLPPSSCLVVVDDFHLPLGTMRFRRQGTDGGHNGLKSIIAQIGEGFPRLRIGIGPVPEGVSVTDFVLGMFTEKELPVKDAMVQRACEGVLYFCVHGIDATMSSFNT